MQRGHKEENGSKNISVGKEQPFIEVMSTETEG
jgi:hypothetical protein